LKEEKRNKSEREATVKLKTSLREKANMRKSRVEKLVCERRQS
jgi:hypothetical protein